MPDLVSDGKIRVMWVPGAAGITNIAAPTVAELNAGLRMDTQMTPEGLTTPASTADVDTGSLSSTFDTKRSGRRSYANVVKIKRQDTADTLLTTMVYRANGFLVVRRNLDAGVAFAAAQKVEVYPSECAQANDAYGPNTIQTAELALMNHSEPNTNATVAA